MRSADLIGRTLAHYQIAAAIGSGGMGEVFRATDTKLGRAVALKVLPSEMARDPERLARFQREDKLHKSRPEMKGVAPAARSERALTTKAPSC